MSRYFEIKDAVRGEIRRRGAVIAYDLPAGDVDGAKLHPLVLERLTRSGVTVPVKTKAKESHDE